MHTLPMGHRAGLHRVHAFHPHGALQVVGDYNSSVVVSLIWTTENLQEKKSGKSHWKEPCNTGSSIDSYLWEVPPHGNRNSFTQPCECVALAEFRFHCLGKHFYGTKQLWWDSIMWDTVLCQRYRTTGGIKQIGMQNRSENDCGARVASCVHPTHTHSNVLHVQNKHG
jgi:hypothetical protein